MERTIIYALIVHWEKKGCRVIANNEIEDSSMYRDVVLEVIRSTIRTDEERISIQRGKYTVHLLIGELRYAALTLTPDGAIYSSGQASSSQIFLDRLRCVYRELPIIADFTHDPSEFFIIDLSSPLNKILEEFNCQKLEIVPKLEENMAEIRRVLMESIQHLIDRGQKLDDLVRKTQSLEITARRDFRRGQIKWRTKKNVMIVLVVLATLLVTIISTMAIGYLYV